jgi:hypothetical protein
VYLQRAEGRGKKKQTVKQRIKAEEKKMEAKVKVEEWQEGELAKRKTA